MTRNKLHREFLEAYLKFKSYVYFENFSIGLKKEISEFEADFDANMNLLCEGVENFITRNDTTYIEYLLTFISYHPIPKKFKVEDYDTNGGTYYSNRNLFASYELDNIKKITPFISCPIEVHILATYWILKIGVLVDKNLKNSCYANRLYDQKKFKVLDRLRLFKRYFVKYNLWRDTAMKYAKAYHDNGYDVAILNLDIENYYHTIDFDLSKLRVTKQYKWVNQILQKVHEKYIEILISDKILPPPGKRILPIGLITSNILANYYLRDLDLAFEQRVNPVFYGRYVDDFLIVFKTPVVQEKSKKIISEFLNENIVLKTNPKDRAYLTKRDESSYSIIVNKNELKFQLSKVKLYYFKKEDNVAMLEEFEKEIKKNSSEFRLQLEEEELANPFEESIYQINYSDTINKLRSIDSFSHNKFGASKQLSKIIFTTKSLNEKGSKLLKEVSKKINEYFIGQRSLELYSLWEKAFSYFVIGQDDDGLIKYSRQILNAISKVKVQIPEYTTEENQKLTLSVWKGLIQHMINCYSSAAALDIKFFSRKIIDKIKNQTYKDPIDDDLKTLTVVLLKRNATNIINANLLKHSYCFYPLLNYCNQKKDYSFVTSQIPKATTFEFDKNKIKLSPRYINFHEVEIFNFIKFTFSNGRPPIQYLNYRHYYNRKIHLKLNAFTHNRANTYIHFENFKVIPSDKHTEIYLDKYKYLDKFRIGLVNTKLNPENNLSSLRGVPNLSLDRLNEINKVLNEALEHKVHIVLFPEISIPFQWIGKLADHSKRNNIGLVFGVEHIRNQKEAFNYVCTILPFRDSGFINSHIDLRLKKDYSPGEIEELSKIKLKKPRAADYEKLRLVSWRNVFFSVFNCFELTDIEKRSYFRGKVDLILAIEYNRDVNYFSSINESYSRDIHAYIIQVNSSNFGDSRITLPKETIFRDYIKIKGGENVSLLIGTLDIAQLRRFQTLPYKKQLKFKELFKPTPPNFKISSNRRPGS